MFSPGFVLLFIQGLLSVPECFMRTKWIGFELVTTVIVCKQNRLSNWNGVFAVESRWGVNELWGLWHLCGLLTLIKKSLFVNNSYAFLHFTYIFLGNDALNDELKFYWKKKSTDVAPVEVWSNLKPSSSARNSVFFSDFSFKNATASFPLRLRLVCFSQPPSASDLFFVSPNRFMASVLIFSACLSASIFLWAPSESLDSSANFPRSIHQLKFQVQLHHLLRCH